MREGNISCSKKLVIEASRQSFERLRRSGLPSQRLCPPAPACLRNSASSASCINLETAMESRAKTLRRKEEAFEKNVLFAQWVSVRFNGILCVSASLRETAVPIAAFRIIADVWVEFFWCGLCSLQAR